MDTTRSLELVSRFRENPEPVARKTVRHTQTVSGTPVDVFPLLCPSREADWIPGWTAELICTESGYAERDCVFRTDESTPVGPGVWVFAGYEPPERVEIVRFLPNVVIVLRVALRAVGEAETGITWEWTFTGLSAAATSDVERMAAGYAEKVVPLTGCLEHYLRTGRSMA